MVEGFVTQEIAVRAAAIGISLFAAFIFLRDSAGLLTGKLTALFAIGVSGYLVCSSEPLSNAVGPLMSAIYAICGGASVFFWWAALALFVDGFRLRPRHLLMLIPVELLLFFAKYAPSDWTVLKEVAFSAHDGLGIILIAHALLVAWRGRAADLVERRRSFRTLFVPVSGLYALIITIVQLLTFKDMLPGWLPALNATGILLVASWLLARSLRLREESLIRLEAGRSELNAGATESKAVLTANERAVLDRLQTAMKDHKIYREQGLSIGNLARQLATREHQLRRVINKGLGYRNFNAFLNDHRLNDARMQLADPDYAHLPVLTIAMDLGFGSVGPFNRAFREATGLTPTEYRQQKSKPNC